MENMDATLPNGHSHPNFHHHAASSTLISAESAAFGNSNLPRRETLRKSMVIHETQRRRTSIPSLAATEKLTVKELPLSTGEKVLSCISPWTCCKLVQGAAPPLTMPHSSQGSQLQRLHAPTTHTHNITGASFSTASQATSSALILADSAAFRNSNLTVASNSPHEWFKGWPLTWLWVKKTVPGPIGWLTGNDEHLLSGLKGKPNLQTAWPPWLGVSSSNTSRQPKRFVEIPQFST